MKLDKFSWEWFGEARTVTVEKELTTIVDGKVNPRLQPQELSPYKNN